MPLPMPNATDAKPDFIDRCMADSVTVKEFPATDQRRAVCERQWKENMSAHSFSAISGAIDRGAGVIRGVSVITTGVARGHGVYIDDTTLTQVRDLMTQLGSTKVKVDHWSGFDKIVGSLQNPMIAGDRVRADFHLIQSHGMYDVILELSEKQPETFGFSIAFSGVPEEKDKLMYARATELYSVDLVDAPAANPSGLFSGVDIEPINERSTMLNELKELLGLAAKNDASLTALQAEVAKVTSLEAKNKELTTALVTVTAERDGLTTQLAEANKATEEAKKSAVTLAAQQAMTITASQGVPPIAAGAPSNAGSTASAVADIEKLILAETDPKKRALLFKKHKKALTEYLITRK